MLANSYNDCYACYSGQCIVDESQPEITYSCFKIKHKKHDLLIILIPIAFIIISTLLSGITLYLCTKKKKLALKSLRMNGDVPVVISNGVAHVIYPNQIQ
ncbi:Hypothetical_protein [Hexamita inflata]|uniref:Hypothetical_protein n=1 Tax=Hexamita inflata TaxID=28002 RepID=A0AA86UVH3_9EUKA|nr:Hypothetical protein HINF_LOCUS61095 [Hexamita inflata]